MNLDELQSVQSRERQTDSLQQLRATFYQDAAAFVQDLREERAKAAERADDPFDSPDVNRLSDDIRTAEQTVEAIYERRVGKVVKMASLAAADMPTEQEGLTAEEQELFETMVTAIENHRESILDVLGGGPPAGEVSSPPPDDLTAAEATAAADSDDGLDAAAMMGEGEQAADPTAADASQDEPTVDDGPADAGGELTDAIGGPGADVDSDDPDGDAADDGSDEGPDGPTDSGRSGESAGEYGAERDSDGAPAPGRLEGSDGTDESADAAVDTDRVTVRITEDVGEIFGVDEREYDLAADDVVTLPTTNAEPLIDRDAAEPIE